VDDRVGAIPFKITELALRGERRAWELQRLPLRDRAKPLPYALEIESASRRPVFLCFPIANGPLMHSDGVRELPLREPSQYPCRA
jgi:hypothetical protein